MPRELYDAIIHDDEQRAIQLIQAGSYDRYYLKTLKFLHASGFDMTTNIVLLGETVEL